MMERYLVSVSLIVLLFTFSVGYSTPVDAYSFQSCGVSNTQMFEFEGLSTIACDIIEYEFNESKGVLAQSACADLKPDYCGMGACKDGWKCQANVNQCMCFPPK